MATPKFKFALCQLTAGADVDANLATAARQIGRAAAKGAKLVCLPEMFQCMSPQRSVKFATSEAPGRGPVQNFLRASAREHRIYLAGGSIIVRDHRRRKLYNRSLMYAPDGRLAGSYDKIHLFRYQGPERRYDEGRDFHAGAKVVTVATELGRIGLSICYDLRFPQLYAAMRRPDIILVPAAFTRSTGPAHWETLLRARAIENQAFVIGAAQCGTHPHELRTWGHSLAFDPWGDVLVSLGELPAVAVGEIDLSRLAKVRASLPTLAHRRKLS